MWMRAASFCLCSLPWLVVGCAHSTTVGPSEPIEEPDSPSHGLSSERLDQLSGGYAALRTARARFGLGAEADACVLLFSDREERLVGCGDSVDGFTETGQHFASPDGRAMPVLWQEGALIMSETHMPYAQIGTQLVGTVATWSRDEGGSAPVLLL